MFDKHSGRQVINFGDFSFNSKRFEVWQGGQMINSGDLKTTINFETLSQRPSIACIRVSLSTLLLETILAHSFYFDISFTSNDRIFAAIVPDKSNCENYNSYAAFKSTALGITRPSKTFEFNEPYVCSIFTINNIPNKITFGLPIAQSLIEFYSN